MYMGFLNIIWYEFLILCLYIKLIKYGIIKYILGFKERYVEFFLG